MFLGEYIDKNSLFHKLNPFIKFMICFIFAVAIFTASSFKMLLAYLFLVIILSLYVGLKIKNYIKIIKITQVFIFFSFFSAFLRNTYPYIYKFFIFTFSSSNFNIAISNSLKILTLALLFQVLFASTKIETILKKIEKTYGKKNAKESRFFNLLIITMLAMYFISFITNEFMDLKNKSTDIKTKKHKFDVVTPIKNYVSILPPVFKNTLQESEKVAEQIDASSYQSFFESNKK